MMATFRFFALYFLTLPFTLAAALKAFSPASYEAGGYVIFFEWHKLTGGQPIGAAAMGLASADLPAWVEGMAQKAWELFWSVSKGEWRFWVGVVIAMAAAALISGGLTALLQAKDRYKTENGSK